MTGPRHSERSPDRGAWPSSAAPHGYDSTEFRPGESRRDFPRRRREPDEERRLLREAEAAFEGPDRRHDADAASGQPWDREAGGYDESGSEKGGQGEEAKSSRLYRE